MPKRKILVLGTADNIGGAAHVGWDIARNVNKYGYRTKFIVGYKKSNSPNVYQLTKNRLLANIESKTRYNLISLFRFVRSFVYANDIDFGAGEEILNHPWYKEADIVHCHNLHGNYFKLRTLSTIASQKPTVWTLHDGWALTAHCAHCYDCKNYKNGKHYTFGINRYGAMLWDNSDYLWNKKKEIFNKSPKLHLVVPSQWLADRVKNSILKDKPLKVINNGINVNIFKPRDKNQVRKELNLPQDKTVVTYVAQMGTIDPRKGGRYFLKTANYYLNNPKIMFLCIGGVIGNKPIQKGNIIYVPFITDKYLMANYYSASDALLFVSLAENFPLVTLEALASGLPIISFDVGGVKEQVKHKINGYIAEYKNTNDLIRGLEFILGLNTKDLDRMKVLNRKIAVEKYSLDSMTKKYVELYGQVT